MINIYVMNKELEKIGVVDNYKSLIWAKRYIESGDCEVYVPATPENIKLFQIDNFIIREDDLDMVCRIESVELQTDTEAGDYLIITGADCKTILNQRVVWRQTNYSGRVVSFVRRLINDNFIQADDESRNIPQLAIGSFSDIDDRINVQTTYDVVGEKIAEICRTYGYGSKVVYSNTRKLLEFRLYRGVDRSYNQTENPYVVFSNDFENLKTSKYLIDKTNYATVALVGGEGEGRDRFLTEVDTRGNGINRYEIFVDAKSISKKISYDDLIEAYPDGDILTDGDIIVYRHEGRFIAYLDSATEPKNAELTDSVYAEMLTEAGEEKLAEMKILTAFEGEVEAQNTYVYKTDYYLGDIVQIKNEFGIGRASRIVEIVESFSDEGYSIIPTFEEV